MKFKVVKLFIVFSYSSYQLQALQHAHVTCKAEEQLHVLETTLKRIEWQMHYLVSVNAYNTGMLLKMTEDQRQVSQEHRSASLPTVAIPPTNPTTTAHTLPPMPLVTCPPLPSPVVSQPMLPDWMTAQLPLPQLHDQFTLTDELDNRSMHDTTASPKSASELSTPETSDDSEDVRSQVSTTSSKKRKQVTPAQEPSVEQAPGEETGVKRAMVTARVISPVQQEILAVLRLHGTQSFHEICRQMKTKILPYLVREQLNELRRCGLVTTKGKTSRCTYLLA